MLDVRRFTTISEGFLKRTVAGGASRFVPLAKTYRRNEPEATA
jgi:hypothetical protein